MFLISLHERIQLADNSDSQFSQKPVLEKIVHLNPIWTETKLEFFSFCSRKQLR